MISIIITLVCVILSVALLTLLERKIKGLKQRRIGPTKVGFTGLLQPIADGVKLIFKETAIPMTSKFNVIIGAPFLFFALALLNWLIIPLLGGKVLVELDGKGLLYTIAIAELAIYGVLFSGWAANSIYPLLGSIRSSASMISYSLAMSMVYILLMFTTGSYNPLYVLKFQVLAALILALLPIALVFALSAVKECNRAPADLPEAESELVSGFMTEHSAISFAYFFLGEYANKIFISLMFSTLFVGISATTPFLFFFIWLRASLPRIRFDALILFAWTRFIPFIIGYFILIPSLLYTFNII